MSLREYYKFHSRKSLKPYSAFFILIVLAFTAYFTFGRYNNEAANSGSFMVAKWSISVNGETMNSSTNTLSNSIQLINSNDGTSELNPGDECYFDLEIDPSTTEVSIIYSILIDLTAGNHPLPTGSSILRYDLYEGDSVTPTTENVNSTSTTISDTILLTNNQPLDSSSVRIYRIYCSIPNNATITGGEEFNVNPTITISQNIQ